MDKYEYRVKTEQMLKLVDQKDFQTAMRIADSIDWRRVKSVSMLCTVSDIYEKNKKYEDARDILLIAYGRSPIGRMILYRLSELAIKMDDFEEAKECYEEFVQVAPKDSSQYVLRYKLSKGQKEPVEKQIEILEEYKQVDYREKWAYELARLYEQVGMTDQCVETCDDLILWFSEGKYVIKAMELKMKHKPLSPMQLKKYEKRFEVQEEQQPIAETPEKPEEKPTAAEEPDGRDTEELAGMAEDIEKLLKGNRTDDSDEDEFREKPAGFFGRLFGRDKVRDDEEEYETDEEEEEDTSGPVSPEESVRIEEEQPIKNTYKDVDIEPVEVNIGPFDTMNLQKELAKNMAEFLDAVKDNPDFQADAAKTASSFGAMEDRQVESVKEETMTQSKAETEKDLEFDTEIEGQMSLFAPQAAAAEEESDLEKQITGQLTLEEILAEWDKTKQAAEEAIAEAERKKKEEQEQKEAQKQKKPGDILGRLAEIMPTVPEDVQQLLKELEEELQHKGTQPAAENTLHEDSLQSDDDIEETNEPDMAEEQQEVKAELPEPEVPEIPEADEAVPEEDAEEEPALTEESEDISEESSAVSGDTKDLGPEWSQKVEEQISKQYTSPFMLLREADKKEEAVLTDAQKKLFSYFVPVKGMSEQLAKVLEADKQYVRGGTSATGNVLLIGRAGAGKTMLAMNLVKAIQRERRKRTGKVAKISASSLNNKSVEEVLNKLNGGSLVIEKAGKLSERTVEDLTVCMKQQTGELFIILEDERTPIKRLLERHEELAAMFESKIEIPIFINDELVTFGKVYAAEQGCVIDDMGILALYTRIDEQQRDDHAVTVAEVKEIIDEAIEHATKGGVKKIVSVFKKRQEETEVVLKEHDFGM